MPEEIDILDDDRIDDAVDVKIAECLNLESPKSFFLFAGAGSGKTKSLVRALESITNSIGEKLRLHGQRVGVITFTKNARDEIKRRLKNDAILHVSTIHSFIWDLIRGFDFDIKKWLMETLTEDISELESKSSRPGTKTEISRLNKIASKKERLRELDNIKKFIYNPNSENTERESLGHPEVLKLGAYFLTKKSLMQKILIKKFPILLIDESQDTNKGFMEALLTVQQIHSNDFLLGLLGDTMQRIYGDGKIDLGVHLPTSWETPSKKMNHRSTKRIIELINKIRSDVDSQSQQARSDKTDGFVRLFIAKSNDNDKTVIETSVMEQMGNITGDTKWNNRETIVSLILEHHMAANRMGFGEMFSALYVSDDMKTGFMDGTLSEVRIFSEIIWPILEAYKNKNKFEIAKVIKNKSRVFKKRYMHKHKSEAKNLLKKANDKVEELCNAYDNNPNITFRQLLQIAYEGGIFEIPKGYKPILMRTAQEQEIFDTFDDENETDESSSIDKVECLDNFLNTKFSQIQNYILYIKEQSSFFTHQGVKGLEFPRVMAIIDDSQMRGFMFSYEKLFGIKSKTNTDIQNENEGKETGIDKTRRLFYVICSRAEESLAVVAYTSNPEGLKESLSGNGWFCDNEIILMQ